MQEPSALELQRPRASSFRWVILGLIFLGTTINYIDRLVIALLAPHLQEQYSISDSQYGYIGFTFGIAYAFGQLAAGGWIDRVGTRVGYALSLIGWSICAMMTALGRGFMSFAILRAMLGVTESPAYPAAAKICAEWFPRRERAFAFGFVNAGSNMAPIIAPLIVKLLADSFGWQAAFIVTGAFGFVLLAIWLPIYKPPHEHPRVSAKELALIQSDPPEPSAPVPWRQLLRHRQAWVFATGKFLTDAMWWFFMSWIPKYLHDSYGLNVTQSIIPLMIIYGMADIGSVGGGLISSRMIHKGFSVNVARKTALFGCALLALPIMFAQGVQNQWIAVFILGLATAAHQGFSSNQYTLCSDLFPRRAVASIAGLGGTFGWIGAALFQIFVGYWVQYTHNYTGPFVCASLAYLLAFIAIHLVSPRLTPAPIDAPENDRVRGFPVD
jgi:ACS family hexuronate transporter-like MFS transporter